MSFDWKKTLGTVAPVLATAFGGPLGGAAVQAIAGALGLSENSEEAIANAISGAKPEDLLKLKQADQEFAKAMRQLDVDVLKTDASDRDSARKLAANGKTPQVILSSIYTLAYGVVIYCFMTGKLSVPADQQVLFGTLIGVLTGAQVQILNFWFGSSSGSKDKTTLLNDK